MRIDILTLFPETLGDVLSESILGRAQERGFITIDTHQIRDYTANKQMQVDDYPYGGGRGAVMQADPLYRCWEAVCDKAGPVTVTVELSQGNSVIATWPIVVQVMPNPGARDPVEYVEATKWEANKYLGTDEQGNVIAKDAPTGPAAEPENR